MTHEPLMVCPDPNCEDLAALSAAVALGSALETGECTRLLASLPVCALCRLRFHQYVGVAQLLPFSVPESEPPAELRTRIITAARQAPSRQAPASRRAPSWRRLALPALASLVLVLLLWNLALVVELRERQSLAAQHQALLLAIFADDQAQERRLQGTAAAPLASGRLWYAPEAGALGLYVEQLPPLPPDRIYQLWLIRHGRRNSAGTFRVDATGHGWIMLRTGLSLTGVDAVGVTSEPEGGSAGPTGPKLLGG